MNEFLRQSQRLEELPPYIFSEINAIKADAKSRGISLLSLGIGDPDRPTPTEIVDKICEAARKPENHVYSPYEGTKAFRSAVASFMQNRFGVSLDVDREVTALIGSKEGIAHFPVAFVNPGDRCLHPSPGYPVFSTAISLSGGIPIPISLRAENRFLPDPEELDRLMAEHQPKYCLLNFPSNPTSATCPLDRMTAIVDVAKRRNVILVHDNAYSEVWFDEKDRPHSVLEVPGAKDIAIEFHSLSKTFNMTGWRIGFAVGNEKLVAGLLRAKTNIDSGPLLAIQEAGIYALANGERLAAEVRAPYVERRERMLRGLAKLGIEVFPSNATFFVWARVPQGRPSMQFTKDLIEKTGLVVTPGMGFGPEGEGFFRLSLTVELTQIDDALNRLETFLS